MEVHRRLDVDKVDRGLIPGGWQRVRDASFTVASYGFVKGAGMMLDDVAVEGAVARWARWVGPEGGLVACPLTAVLAFGLAAGT